MTTVSAILAPRHISASGVKLMKAGAPHVVAIGIGLAIRDEVKTQLPFGALDPPISLAGRHAQGMALFATLDRPFRNLIQCLLEDAQALTHLFQPHQVAGIHVAAVFCNHVKVESVVDAVGLGAPNVVWHT